MLTVTHGLNVYGGGVTHGLNELPIRPRPRSTGVVPVVEAPTVDLTFAPIHADIDGGSTSQLVFLGIVDQRGLEAGAVGVDMSADVWDWSMEASTEEAAVLMAEAFEDERDGEVDEQGKAIGDATENDPDGVASDRRFVAS